MEVKRPGDTFRDIIRQFKMKNIILKKKPKLTKMKIIILNDIKLKINVTF